MPQLRHTRRARRDLLGIWLDIAAKNEAAADAIFESLARRAKILEQFPEAGPLRHDIAPDARFLVERPYIILYRIIPEGVQIVRVLHGARHIGSDLFAAGTE